MTAQPTWRRRVALLAGLLIAGVGLAFVGRRLWSQRSEIQDVAVDPPSMVVALGLAVMGLAIIGLGWRFLLYRLGGTMPLARSQQAYFVGQLGKYIPGGFWPVVGRGEWARREGVVSIVGYTSTVLSMLTAYLAAALLGGFTYLVFRPQVGSTLLVGLVMVVVPVGFVSLHPTMLSKILAFAARLFGVETRLRKVPFDDVALAVGLQVGAWLCIGGATWMVSNGLSVPLPAGHVLVATCVAWVCGFLLVPVPGGLGVREAVFVTMVGGGPDAAAVALVSRVLFVFADLAGAALAATGNALMDGGE